MQTIDDILFSAPGPDPIPTATTEIVGTPGNALNVYWIVSHFPIGSVVSGPFPQKDSPNVLDDENYVHISWLATPGASSYDLLFTRELQLPRQPGNFALALNLTETEFRDEGQSLNGYDLAGIPLGAPQEEHIYFDNRDRKQPTLRFIPWPIEVSSIIFEDGTSLNTAGAAGGAAPPDRSIQFNNNGAFGGSPNLIWDNVDLRIGLGTQNPVQPLHIVNPNGLGYIRLESFSPDLRTLYSGLEFYTSGQYVAEIGAWVHNDPINDGLSIDLGDSINNIFINHASGYVGINTGNPQYRLDVNGDFRILGPTGGSTVFSVDSFDTLQVTNVGGVQASSFRTDLVQGGALVVQSTGTFLTISGLYTNLTAGNTLTLTGNTFLRLNSSNEVDIDASGACVIRGNATIQVRTPNLQFQDSSGGGLTIVTPTEFAIFVALNVDGDINTTSSYRINGVSFAAPYLSGPDIALSNVTRIESPSSGVTVNAGANAIQFLFGASNTVILSSGFADFYGVFTRIFGLFQVQNALTVFDNGNIEMTNLPSADPGVGSKRIWYDPADGNIVKYAA